MHDDRHRSMRTETSHADEGRPEPVAPRSLMKSSPSGIPPIKAFAGLVVLLIVSGTTILITKPEASIEDAETNIAASDNFALTNAEAIARFRKLRRKLIAAVAARDVSLLPHIFTSDSPNKQRTTAAIYRLLRDHVLDKSKVDILSIEVLANSPDQVRIRERVSLIPCFVSETGRDVTATNKIIDQINTWVLAPSNSGWALANGAVHEDAIVRSVNDSCR